MAKRGIAKVQHYVPQFLLRNFSHGKKDHVHVFDKRTRKSFPTNVKNIASESRFYDFELEGHKLTVEPSLSSIEAKVKPLLQRLLDLDNLSALSVNDRDLLSAFFSIQLARTRYFREQWRSLPEMLGQKLRAMTENEGQLKNVEEYMRVPDENETKAETIKFMMSAPKDFAVHFARKTWVLLKTEKKTPFVIGDNPLALQNMNDMGPRGNLGLAVPGIEIYFPLSPTRALGLWCQSHEELIRKGVQKLRSLSQAVPNLVAAIISDPPRIEQTLIAIESGCPLLYGRENVVNFNSLQVHYSERFVFSCSDNFDLVLEMLSDHPELEAGPRVQMN